MGQLFLFYNLAAQQVVSFSYPVAQEDLDVPTIKTMAQDSEGFVWLGTHNGLSRFDGLSIQTFRNDPLDPFSLSHNEINTLYYDNKTLWIGTNDGLDKFNPDLNRIERVWPDPNNSQMGCSSSIYAIHSIDESTLWLGTQNGLCKLNVAEQSVDFFSGAPLNQPSEDEPIILTIASDTNNNLWLGSTSGLFFLSNISKELSKFPLGEFASDSQNVRIEALEIQNSRLWIGTDESGLFYLDESNKKLQKLDYKKDLLGSHSPDSIQDLLVDHSGNLWIASSNSGLCVIQRNSTAISCFEKDDDDSASLISNQTWSLMEDYEGQLWVGTWAGVAVKSNNLGFEIFDVDKTNPTQGLSNPIILDIHEDHDGNLWLGTLGSGIDVYSPKTKTVKNYQQEPNDQNSLSSNSVYAVTQKDHFIWIGTAGGGVDQLDTRSGTFRNFMPEPGNPNSLSAGRIYSLLFDRNESLWIGTVTGGLNNLTDENKAHFERYNTSSRPDSLYSNEVWALHQTNDDYLWIGLVDGGIARMRIPNKELTHFIHDPQKDFSITNQGILYITSDSEDDLWIGTLGAGMQHFEKSTERFYSYTTDDGLPNNVVSCILQENNERLWIGTEDGLSVFDLENRSFIKLYHANGIPDGDFNAGACIKSRIGKFHFGTTRGLLSFFPDSIKLNLQPPRIAISEFRINNKPALLPTDGDNLVLKFEENNVSFKIAALSFIDPDNNQYFYKESETDSTWLPMENGLYPAPNLAPAQYNLQFMVKNSYGLSSEVLTIPFRVKPIFWSSWPFRFLALGFLVALLTGIYRARVNYLLGIAQKEHEAQLRIEQIRTDIAADFHDGIGSGIGSLGLEIDLLAGRKGVPIEIAEELNRFRDRLDKISDIRREMTWMIDNRNDALQHLVDRLREAAFEIIPAGMLSVDVPESVPDIPVGMYVRKHVLLLIKEALHNAAKHAQPSHIHFSIKETANGYRFSVIDDGIGFDPSRVARGDGLDNMFYRADAINADLEIINLSQEGKTGTAIAVTIKMDDLSHDETQTTGLD